MTQIISLQKHVGAKMLADWEKWQKAQGLSARTITERLSTIRMLLASTGATPQTLTPEHIIDYCSRDNLSASSKASYHATIRAFCKWMNITGIRDDDPTTKTPTPKRPKGHPRPITDQQLHALLQHANRGRTRAYILLAAYAGLRVHEIAKIRGEDFDGKYLTVTGKGNKTEVLPLHPQLIQLARSMPQHGWWFPAYTGDLPHVGPHAVSDAIRHCMRRAGFDGKAHQLRHTFATRLVRQGVDLSVVQKLMRHESPATTVIYTEIPFDLLESALSRLAA